MVEEQDGGGWRRRKELTFVFFGLVRGANTGVVEGAMSLVQSNLLMTDSVISK